jgi:MFS superfamily sulfate permease-like transporter
MANIAAAFTGAFIVNGSPTKTAMVDTAGGRSQWSHLTTFAIVLLVLLFFTRPLSLLPTAVLASIVFLIGVKLVDTRGLREIRRERPREYRLALLTGATVIVFGVEGGIILAVVVSLVEHVRHSYRPHTGVFVRDGRGHWQLEDAEPGKVVEPGLVMFRFGADLFYANVGFFIAETRRLIHRSPTPIRWFVVDATAITDVDFSASRALTELQRDLIARRIVLALIVASTRREDALADAGIIALTDATRIFDSRDACASAYALEQAADVDTGLSR